LNVYRLCLHPDGLARRTINFADWADYLLGQLRRSIALTNDAGLIDLQAELTSFPDVAALDGGSRVGDDPPLLVPLRLRAGDHELALFTTLTTFGTPQDVTLQELAVELFFPEDEATEALLRAG
jgi:hypothetical protein